ncbi:MAG: DNA repair exonuclease [Rhodospirillales bacterium]|jgi:exonuclease SbcD|nr:DNA repair exonuclease [Rhodospirillales bacterium]
MSSFVFLHAADLHIDSPLRGLEAGASADRIRTATRVAFTNLVDLALRERVAFVVIAGDVFDGDWPDWRTGQFFVQETLRLTRAGIRVVLIRGNHDAQSVVSQRLSLPEGARMLATDRPETLRFAEHNVCVHGQSFATREVTENLVRNYPAPVPGNLNIGVLHTSASGRPGHATYAPCTVEQLITHGYDYWALGHVHAREVLSRSPWIVFPGNTQGRHVGEVGPKGATLVTVRDGRIEEAVHHELDVVRWAVLDIDVTGADDEEQVFAATRARLADELGNNAGRLLAVRLVLTGACDAHSALSRDLGATRDKLRGEAAASATADELWLETVKVRTRPALDLAAMRARTDAVGLLVQGIEAVDATDLAASAQKYCAALLDRASGLRVALGEDHPAVRAAAGTLPPELLARAKALLLARLAEGD